MSERTKAEVEAENAELKAENAELRALVSELERDNRNLRDARDMILEGAEWDQYKLKVTDQAFHGAIKEYCDYRNESGGVLNKQHELLEKHHKGVDEINKDAPARKAFITERFQHYRREGHNLTNARDLANKDLHNSEFKYRYGPRWLIEKLKD